MKQQNSEKNSGKERFTSNPCGCGCGPFAGLVVGRHCPLQRERAIAGRRWRGPCPCVERNRPSLVWRVEISLEQVLPGAGRRLLTRAGYLWGPQAHLIPRWMGGPHRDRTVARLGILLAGVILPVMEGTV